jgi:hypothetical protein
MRSRYILPRNTSLASFDVQHLIVFRLVGGRIRRRPFLVLRGEFDLLVRVEFGTIVIRIVLLCCDASRKDEGTKRVAWITSAEVNRGDLRLRQLFIRAVLVVIVVAVFFSVVVVVKIIIFGVGVGVTSLDSMLVTHVSQDLLP